MYLSASNYDLLFWLPSGLAKWNLSKGVSAPGHHLIVTKIEPGIVVGEVVCKFICCGGEGGVSASI
jgi:hypothetical protein